MERTQGPWEVFTIKDEPQLLNFHSAIYGPKGDYDGLFVALANQNGRYEADALLIGTAPELLDLLQRASEADSSDEDVRTAWWEERDAAIAKATGKL